MKHLLTTILTLGLSMFALSAQTDTDNRFMRPFTEDFSNAAPQYFGASGSQFRYYCGVPSLTKKDTDVMLMRISPNDPAGAGRGPEIATAKRTHFGTYSTRIRVPDVKAVQPNTGAVVGFFTYRFTNGYGLSEIDIEWLIADPTILYIGTWTSDPNDVNKLQRVGRTINLATGRILYTNYRSFHDGMRTHNFDSSDDAALSPRTISAIKDFNAAKHFYTYGFDWYPDRLTWWIINPETNEKMILWDYRGTTPNFSGIPQPPSTFLLNFWHTNDWAVDTNPNSKEKPAYPYMLEVDWMKYEPYDELNIEWRQQHNY